MISPTSTTFYLRTDDGRTIPLDSASNAKVMSQLKSNESGAAGNQVMHVTVTGTENGNVLSVNDFQTK